MRNLIVTFNPKEEAVMQWYTQVGNIITNQKI